MTLTEPTADTIGDMTDPDLVAVYGTLRTGEHNACLWEGQAESEGLGTVRERALVVASAYAPFPYCVPAVTGRIVVELLRIDPAHKDELLARLDRLEGVPHHYTRTLCRTEAGQVAWLYLAAPDTAERLLAHPDRLVITSGDWMKWSNR